jgi:hypothetical protein
VRVETVADQLFFVTVLISATGTDGSEWTGTGFAYAVNTDKGPVHYLVTNRHVLEYTSRVVLHFVRGHGNQPIFGSALQAELSPLAPTNWAAHQDRSIDVAVLPLGLALNELTRLGQEPYFRALPETVLPNTAELESFDALERVIFIGYPSGLYDRANLTPIARQGLAATPITLDYNGLPAFLIDAAVFPGSSGSPVFIFDRGTFMTRSGNTTVGGTRLHLLGVLAAVHQSEVEAEIASAADRQLARFKQVIGLGIVFKSHTINECVDQHLAKHGFIRVPPAAETTQVVPPTEGTTADKEISDSDSQGTTA